MDRLKQIVRTNLRRVLNEQYSENVIGYIFDMIKNMPAKYKLQTKEGDKFDKLYSDGISTAINNSMVTRFYLKYLKNQKKTTSIMPGPRLNPTTYDKLNNLIIAIDKFHVPYESSGSTSLLNMSEKETWDMNYKLLRAMCFQMMNMLIYGEYFDIDFFYGDPHKIVNELNLPQKEEDLREIYNQWSNKEGEVRLLLFRADSNDIIRTIENY